MYPNNDNQPGPRPPQYPPAGAPVGPPAWGQQPSQNVPNNGYAQQPSQPQFQQPYQQSPQPQGYQQAPQQFQPQQPYQPQPFQSAPLPPQSPANNPYPQPLNRAKKISRARGPAALLFNDWMQKHWKLTGLIALGLIILGILLFQIVYPNSRMLPGASVDGVALGSMKKIDAAKKLDELYGESKLDIYFGKNEAAFLSPKMKDVGIGVDNEARLAAINYPVGLRFVPGSFLWAGKQTKSVDKEYVYDKEKIESYTQSQLNGTCSLVPRDATLKLIDSQLQVVTSVAGGSCDITQFQQALAQVKPDASGLNEVRISIDETPAKVDNDKARELADMLNNRLREPMPMTVGSESQSIPGRIVLGWLDFKSDIPPENPDGSSTATAKLAYSINSERMLTYLNANVAQKVIKAPGVSKVSTNDFVETSRVNGQGGTEIDADKILASVDAYINSKAQTTSAVTRAVGPTTNFTRTYTPTSNGFSAILSQFAQDNPGTYGLMFNEMSGVRNLRSASFRPDVRYKSGGMESLYLAYASVIDLSTGALRPAEKISGSQNVEACTKAMFEKSDELCRQGLYERLGFEHTTQLGAQIGLRNTVFAGKDSVTAPSDIHSFMTRLYKDQIARAEGGSRLLAYAKTTRSSEGIPTGAGSNEVAHVVGEVDGIRNDSAIVYSNKGIFILTVMSDGSSWEKISNLTKKLIDLKQVKVPNDAK